jgi:hypothetical protein
MVSPTYQFLLKIGRLAEVLNQLAVDYFDVTGRREECDEPRDAVQDPRDFTAGDSSGASTLQASVLASFERIRTR